MGRVDARVEDGDGDALAVEAGLPCLRGADPRDGPVEGDLADAVQPEVGDPGGGGAVGVGDRLPQRGGVVPGSEHRLGVQCPQGAADLGVARRPYAGPGAGGGSGVADDQLQALLLGGAGRRRVQRGDVEQPPVDPAGGDEPGRVGRQDVGVAVGLAHRQGDTLTALGPLQAEHAAPGVDEDAVTGDERDATAWREVGGGHAAHAGHAREARQARRAGHAGHALGYRGRRAGRARRQRHGGHHGDRGRARALGVSAQVSPLIRFIRPGELPHIFTSIPPVYGV